MYTRILLSFFLEWIDEGMQDETQVQLEDYFTLVDGSMNSGALLRFKNAEEISLEAMKYRGQDNFLRISTKRR
ncbi:MAG: hypothetical protein ACLR2O_08875 [Coprococcus sp.]